MKKNKIIWILLRLSFAWIMLWAFFDKVFGLGISTSPEKAWLAGNSPTTGFLKGVNGPFAGIYNNLAGNPIIDWLFMLGLLLIGLALLFGIAMKIASYSGGLFMFLLWTASIWPKNNPFLDKHLIYALIFLSFSTIPIGDWFGLGKWWKSTALVKKYKFLE